MLMLFKDFVLTIPWWITTMFFMTLISLVVALIVFGVLLLIMVFGETDL